jgi:hypothetical protein
MALFFIGFLFVYFFALVCAVILGAYFGLALISFAVIPALILGAYFGPARAVTGLLWNHAGA